MKLSENVEIESNEISTTNSRAARMARYSTAAAGVAAVSTLDVDAAMIKVIVTDPNAAGSYGYTLDLSHILSGASIFFSTFSDRGSIWMGGSSFGRFNKASFATSDSSGTSADLRLFNNGDEIAGKLGKSWLWNAASGLGFDSSATSGIFGFRINQGSNDYTYGWLKATMSIGGSSSFTLNSYGYNDTLNAAAIAGQGSSAVPDSGPGVVGLALLGAGAAGMRLLRKLRAGK